MTPVLFDANETQFNSMGIGALADAISCLVHEARNGAFELTLEYPVDAPLYAELLEDRIIKAKANDNANMDDQLFRIYKSGKPLNGQCTFYAEHITGELAKNPISHVSISGGTAQQFGQAILANTIYPHRFSFVSSDSTIASSDLSRVPAAQALVGIEGSLIDRWRGELTRDNFVIREEQNRGEDTGIIIEYGKNLTDATQEKAIDETYTSIYPYATIQASVGEGDSTTTESQVIELPEKIIESPYVGNYAYGRCLPIDLSGDDVTDETSLRSKAQAYVTQNDFGKPKVNLAINFIQLWQMEEYKNVAPLEHVNLCDWVTVRFKKIGIDSKVKVIDGVFDSLVEKWTSMELGDASTGWDDSLSSSISDVSTTANQAAKISGYALTQANGKNKTYFSAAEPSGNLVSGDLWYKIVNGQYTEMWRYNGIAWNKILSADANDALNKAIDALTAANGKNTVYHQAAQPIVGNNGDIWFRENADGTVTIFVYQDGQWVNPVQDGVKAAQDQANTAVATADAASTQAISAAQDAATGINIANAANSAAQAAQSTASSAASQASSAWNNAQTAIGNAQSALDAYNNLDINARNLAIQNELSKGYFDNSGNWVDSSDGSIKTTDYIDVSNTDQIVLQQFDGFQNFRIAQFDANKIFIRRWLSYGVNPYIWSVPGDVTYIRVGCDNSAKMLKITYGNQPTGWSPAPEDVQVQIDNINGTLTQKVSQSQFDTLAGTVSSQATAITQNQQDIALKANKDYVDTINQTVNSHSTQINENAQAITFKADASTVNTLTGRVSTAEATLTTQANQIAARITSQDADAKYATQTSLTATSSSLTSSISAVQTNLNNLQVGGRNFAIGTATPFSMIGGGYTNQNTGDSIYPLSADMMASLRSGDYLAVSFDWEAVGTNPSGNFNVGFNAAPWWEMSITNGIYLSAGNMSGHFEGSKQVTTDFISGSTNHVRIRFDSVPTSITINIKNVKIERGNKATDWTPAPEDMATVIQFTSLSQTLSGFQTTVQQDYATKSLVTQTAQTLQSSIDGKVGTDVYNSKVSQLSNDINARVAKNDVVHQINISTEGILIDGSKTHITGQTTIDNAVINNAMIVALDAGKITTGTLDANRIGAKSITVDKMDVAELSAISQNVGWVTAGTINAVDINGGTITGTNMSGSGISGGSITGAAIYGSTITGTAFNSLADHRQLIINGSELAIDFDQTFETGDRYQSHTGLSNDYNASWGLTLSYIHTLGSWSETSHTHVSGRYGIETTASIIAGDKFGFYGGNASLVPNNADGLDINTGNNGWIIGCRYDNNIYTLNARQDVVADGWMRASNFVNTSRVELKTDITPLDDNIGLSLVNSLGIYKFKYKEDVKQNRDKFIYGGIIGEGYSAPDDFMDFDHKGMNLYSSTFIGLKAIQELTKLHQQDVLKIAELESRLSVAESKIASLEAA